MVKSFKRPVRTTPLDPEHERSKSLQAKAAIELIHEGTPRVVHISDIRPSPLNQRVMPFDSLELFQRYKANPSEIPDEHQEQWSELVALAENIREFGLIHPIVVKEVTGDPVSYEIIAGERRYWALRYLGREAVAVNVRLVKSSMTHEIISFTENLARSNLTIVEKVTGMRRLIEQDRRFLDRKLVAEKAGISLSSAKRLVMAASDDEIYQRILSGQIKSIKEIDTHSQISHGDKNNNNSQIKKKAPTQQPTFRRLKFPAQTIEKTKITTLVERYKDDPELLEILQAINSQIKEAK